MTERELIFGFPKNSSGYKIQNVIADAGYASEENYTFLEDIKIEVYIKPNQYEIRKAKKFKKDIFRVENLVYEEETDCYLCLNGKHLKYAYESHNKSETDT